MFIDKVQTEGLAHYSYVVGDGTAAAVIDPRRDCDIYIRMARERGAQITHILETHRNEDFVSGAVNLAEATGAKIWRGPDAGGQVSYADTAREGDTFKLGKITLSVLETPGHTDDSLSFVMLDREFGNEAIAVFTGDSLFIGDVGRTDLAPGQAAENAGKLYDSLSKLLALGDHTIIFPAHGAGSLCGDKLADRDFSTIGYERRNNPLLRIESRADFVERKLAEQHYTPPYFQLMERLNRRGMEEQPVLTPPPLGIDEFNKLRDDAVIVDVRNTTAFLGAHIPGSLSLPLEVLPTFAGWLLEPEQSVLLVADSDQQARRTAEHLARIGYDNIVGYLSASLPAWVAAGNDFRTVSTLGSLDLENNSEALQGLAILDVRGRDEVRQDGSPAADHIYVGELPRHLHSLDRDDAYLLVCASGVRATIAASLLLRAGLEVKVFLGSAQDLNAQLPAGFAAGKHTMPAARQGSLFR